MRTFGVLAKELLQMAGPTVEGVATGNWSDFKPVETSSRAEILRLWDENTGTMKKYWPTCCSVGMNCVSKAKTFRPLSFANRVHI